MTWGKPVIGSCFAAALVDYVRPEINGFIAEPGNIEQIVKAMLFFVDHPDAIMENCRKAWTNVEKYLVDLGLATFDHVIKLP